MESLLRGELAALTNVNPETIRFYEREGLLPEPPRNRAGYRLFAYSAVQRVAFIKNAQAVGFSLSDVKALFLSVGDGRVDLAALTREVDRQIAEIDGRIERLRAMRRGLEEFKAQGSDAAHCPHIRAFLAGFPDLPLDPVP